MNPVQIHKPLHLRLLILFLLFHTGAQSGVAGEFKPRIDAMVIKFTRAIRDTRISREQKKIVAIISTAEAFALCAEMEKIPPLQKPIAERVTQFHDAVRQAGSTDEKVYHAGIGIFNFLLMIANIRAGLTPFQTPIRLVEKQAVRIQETDSLSVPMKSALLLSESFKLTLIAAAAVDSLEKHRDEIKAFGLAFDAEARNVKSADEGLAIAGRQLARTFGYYSILRYPGMRSAFEEYSMQKKKNTASTEEEIIDGFTSLFYTVVLHARRLDQ